MASALADGTLEKLRGIGTATVTMQLLKRGLRNVYMAGPRPFRPESGRLAAEAYTLRFIPMREDLSRVEVLGDLDYAPRKVIEATPPGRVLVIDARGEPGAGTVGDILVTRLKARGVAGIVTDGPVRDGAEIALIDFPIFCTGSAAPASLNRHFGADHDCPIGCGGVAVLPGDVIVGDGDGVVVVPRALADAVARDGFEQELLEGFLKSRIEAGHPAIGTYPPNAETLAAYETWRRERGT